MKRPAGSERDLLDVMERAIERAIGVPAAARVMANECAMVYYALRWGRAKPVTPGTAGERAFEVRRSLAVIAVLGMAVAAETAAVHLLISRWSAVGAWVFTGLSAYTLLWFFGDYRAIASRPTLLSGDELYIRVGLRCRARVPLAAVESVARAGWRDTGNSRPEHLNLAAPFFPNVVVVFREPVTARRIFGIAATVRSIGLDLKDPEAFISALSARLV